MHPRSSWTACLEEDLAIRSSGRYKDLLLDWIEAEVDRAGSVAASRLTPEAWPKARIETRARLLQSLGMDPLPPRTTAPLLRSAGVLERDGYRLERLVLEPRPGFLMPAQLYVPAHVPLPTAAILYSPGHWMIHGKAEPDIQACCIGLARLGFVVLTFDPIGQGERGATFEDHARRDLLLLGLSQEGLMAWESMRAIDYLLTRPEVDGNRIGMTGASGGGLNTIYTCAADERIAASVPVCYVTSFSRFLRAMRGLNWNNQNDLCNQVPNVIGYAEMAGLCGLIYPRPLMVINGTLDPQFPVDGAQQVIDQIQDLYAMVGSDRLRLTAVEADHGYDQAMREAAYGWFSKWLLGKGDGSPIPEPPLVPEPPESEDLRCLPGTPYIRSWPAIRELARTAAQALAPDPALPSGAGSWQEWTTTLRRELADKLGNRPHMPEPTAITSTVGTDGAERHVLETEPGMIAPLCLVRPHTGVATRTLIFLADEGRLSAPGAVDLLSTATERGVLSITVDPRGIGETTPLPPPTQTVATLDGKLDLRPTTAEDTLEFEVATDALMLGRSLFGMQVSDLRQAVRYASQLAPGVPITVVGSGPICSLVALFAAALDDSISAVVADRLLPSYRLLVDEDTQVFPITPYVFGILRAADIPQIAGAIAPRRLAITRPIDAQLQEMDPERACSVLNWTFDAFQARGATPPTVLGPVSNETFIALALGEPI